MVQWAVAFILERKSWSPASPKINLSFKGPGDAGDSSILLHQVLHDKLFWFNKPEASLTRTDEYSWRKRFKFKIKMKKLQRWLMEFTDFFL